MNTFFSGFITKHKMVRAKRIDNNPALKRARHHLQQGHWQQAQTSAEKIIQRQPEHGGALNLLGEIALRQSEYEPAIHYFTQAITHEPDCANHYTGLGFTYLRMHRFADAIELYNTALDLNPDAVAALEDLAGIMAHQGHYQNALNYYQRLLILRPDYALAYSNMGIALEKLGELEQSQQHYQKALQLKPEFAEAHTNLGNLLAKQEHFDTALQHYQQALKFKPDLASAHSCMGNVLAKLGQLDKALQHQQQALALNPSDASSHGNLANLLVQLGQGGAAIKHYQQALKINPDDVHTLNNFANLLEMAGQNDVAEKYFLHALSLNPDFAEAHDKYANLLAKSGRFSASFDHHQQALSLRPDFSTAHSNLLYILSFYIQNSPADLLKEAQRWDSVQGQAGRANIFKHRHAKINNANKRLRIGYVSPDFKKHAVSYFFETLLDNHDKRQVDIFCYAEVASPDAVTRRLQAKADHWYNTTGKNDQEVARKIYADEIDILIDLSGHTANNRLKVFTYKPAPVQAGYLGYCSTTGLASMDYWITDSTLLPQDTVEQSCETIYRLPRCWLSYRPVDDAPDIVVTRNKDKPLTFGSLNQLSKLSPEVIALWSEILRQLPASRLLLKTNDLQDHAVQQQLYAQFLAQGIVAERLELLAGSADYLTTYNHIDIALDPFPRTGGATTADALWMGVPVITLAGERMIERQGASMLNALGYEEWIAHSKKEYIDIATRLGNDGQHRSTLHAELRQRMADSPLCDGIGLARALETAYREMYKKSLCL